MSESKGLEVKKQSNLRDVAIALENATSLLDEIEQRAEKREAKLSFEQRVIAAVRAIDNGDPMKDFLTYDEIEQAVKTLADVYIVTGVCMPDSY